MELHKLEKVETRYKLSKITEYFGLTREQVISTLNEMIAKRSVFDHDIKKVGKDYLLSSYALTCLIMRIELSEACMRRLDRFVKSYGKPAPAGEYLARLRVVLHMKLIELELLKNERQGSKKKDSLQLFGDSIH